MLLCDFGSVAPRPRFLAYSALYLVPARRTRSRCGDGDHAFFRGSINFSPTKPVANRIRAAGLGKAGTGTGNGAKVTETSSRSKKLLTLYPEKLSVVELPAAATVSVNAS